MEIQDTVHPMRHDALLQESANTISFLMSQVKQLAEQFWSADDAAEWLLKCDAYNAGLRTLKSLSNATGNRSEEG